jgi:hypothetical protein
MTNGLDPLEILDDVSPGLEKALEDPSQVNFRPNDEEFVPVYPEHPSFRQAYVDEPNQNVEIKLNTQTEKEGYNTVVYQDGIAIVESQAEIRMDNRAKISTEYYLVTDQKTHVYNQNRWRQLYNPLPRTAAKQTPVLHQKAENKEPLQEDDFKIVDAVPPPKKDKLF